MLKQLSLFDPPIISEGEKKKSFNERGLHRIQGNKAIDLSTLSKLYYSISEVAYLFQVNTSLLRFWEKEFPHLFVHLKKNKKGDRFYAKKDIEIIKILFYLIKEKKMTLEGARDFLKNNKRKINDEKTLLENLLKIREFLVDLKNKIQ